MEVTTAWYRAICGIAFVLSIFSCAGSTYIIYSWRKNKKLRNNDLLNNYVAYMSMADLFLVFTRGIYVSNPTFLWTFMSQVSYWPCLVLGAAHNYAYIATTTWNFVIVSFIFLPMLRGIPMYNIQKKNKYILIFVFVVCLISWILPFITVNEGSYGFTNNGEAQYGLSKFQCWLVDADDYLTLYIFVFIYFWWSIAVLLYAYCKFRNVENMKQLTSRLFWYTVGFVFTWSGSMLNRFYRAFTGDIFFGFLMCQWITLHSAGIINGLVWYSYMNYKNSPPSPKGGQDLDVHVELTTTNLDGSQSDDSEDSDDL
eukprot:98113_1